MCYASRVGGGLISYQDYHMLLLTLAGRVGTVTATWHAEFERYLLTVTTPTIMPSTVGPYDTYVLETPSLTEGPFHVVSYMYVQPPSSSHPLSFLY